MGLDSECNIVMRPKDEGGAVRAFRHRLIAHHLGVDTEEYANMESKHRGMLKAVESLRREHGGLRPEADSRNGNGLPVDPEMARALDSSHPGIYDAIMDEYGSDDSSRASFSRFIGFGAMLTVFVVLALAWRFTPLSDYATADTLLHWAATVRQLPFAPAFAVLAFVLGGLIMFPAMLLIVLTASIFEPVPAFAISLTGSLASALVVYGIGSMLGVEDTHHQQAARQARPGLGPGGADCAGGTLFGHQPHCRCVSHQCGGIPSGHVSRHGARNHRHDAVWRPAHERPA
jgi:hypothetical protein